jgi:hypothetical protein
MFGWNTLSESIRGTSGRTFIRQRTNINPIEKIDMVFNR